MAAIGKLKEQGWYLSEDGIRKLSEDGKIVDLKDLTKRALDTDLKEISKGWISSDYQKYSKLDTPGLGVIMQIVEIRNISAPKYNEESKVAPRLLQIDLTDGQTHIRGIEMDPIMALSTQTGPGTKILLKGNIVLTLSMMLLSPQNISVIGGRVPNLYDKWEEQRILRKYTTGIKPNTGPNGPPPWVPFGQKIQMIPADKSFKSLNGQKPKELTKEEIKFLATRDDLISEALKLDQRKICGNGSRNLVDHNVKKIMDKGYTEDQAKTSLKYYGNNLEKAMGNLKRREEKTSDNGGRMGGNGGPKSSRNERSGRKGRTEIIESSKPSGNVSIFDFIEDKIPSVRRPTAQNGAAPSHQSLFTSDYMAKQNYSQFSSYTPPSTATLAVSSDTKIKSNSSNYTNKHDDRKNNTGKMESVGRSSTKTTSNVIQSSSISVANQSTSNTAEQRSKFENNISTSFANRQKKEEEHPRQSYKNNSGNKSHNYAASTNGPTSFGDLHQHSHRNQNIPTTSRSGSGVGSGGLQSSVYGSSDSYQKSSVSTKERSGNGSISLHRNSHRYDENKNQSYQHHPSSNTYDKRSSKPYNASTNANANQLADLTASIKLSNKPDNRYQSNCPGQTQLNQQQQHHKQSYQQQHTKSTKSSERNLAQISIGIEFNPYKIVGFQNKEINEFAMNVLKTQSFDGISQYTQPPPAVVSPGLQPPTVQPHQTSTMSIPPSLTSQSTTSTTVAPTSTLGGPSAPASVHHHQQHQHPSAVHNKFIPMQSFNTPPPSLPKPQLSQQQPQSQLQHAFMAPNNIHSSTYNWSWKINDICLAKYWEDGQFYTAEITAVADKTCVVQFLEYGNFEEVLHADCLPITEANINQFNGNLAPHINININYQQSASIQQQQHHHHQQQHQQQAQLHHHHHHHHPQSQQMLQQQHQQSQQPQPRFRSDRQMYVPPAQRTAK